MFSKTVSVFLVVYLFSDFSHGQTDKTFFREDYSYIETTEGFYKIHTIQKTWADAKRVCALEGASFFYPDNGDEANAVISFWKRTQPNITWAFVGMSDIKSEGVFETIDGKSVSEVYNQWQPGQPNKLLENRDCIHLNLYGKINDVPCDAKANFICKKSLQSLEWNYRCNMSNLDGQRDKKFFHQGSGYIKTSKGYYKIHTSQQTWANARRVCALEGASLFYPDNKDEANTVISFWKWTQPNIAWVFVGMSDIKSEGIFETIDGKSVSEVYNQWQPGQPNKLLEDRDCIHLNLHGNINDVPCYAKANFICKSLQLLEWNRRCNESDIDGQRNETAIEQNYSYIEAGKSFYKFHRPPKNWRDAKQVCEQEGASLFYPENSNEANAMISIWRRLQNNTQSHVTWLFVGISDTKTEGVFETVDGKSISEVYKKWLPNQPDNSDNEDCVHLNQDGNINDISCDSQFSFICKKSLTALEQNCGCNIHESKLDGQKNETAIEQYYRYIEAGKSFYKFHRSPKNWRDAKQVCEQEGASLFYPENSNEANAMISIWRRLQNNTQSHVTWLFVGISDTKTEGVFETVNGKSISEVYKKWVPNQPDNSDNEDCVHLNQDGNINDISCDSQFSFICKKSLMALELQNYGCYSHESKLDGKNATKQFRKDYSYIEAVESFYKVHTTPQSWAEAKRVCALEGATFWHPDNDDEAHAVISFWNTTQPHLRRVYVGMSDKMVKGLFETIDGKSVSEVYKNWQPGQPDDNGGKQECVYIYKNGSLDDWGCDDKYSFICKKSILSLEWNDRCNIPISDYTFNEDNGKCYKLHTTPLNWNDSYAVCRLEQSNLAVISSRQVSDYLVNLTKSTPKPLVKENYQRGIYHVGFHNRFNEGWQTVKGIPMHVDADAWWDNYKPADDRVQCGSMFYNGRLINTDCAMKSFFICEHELAN